MPVAAPPDLVGRPAGSVARRTRRRRPSGLWALALVGLAALLVGALPTSDSAFVSRQANSANSMAAATWFTCSNAITSAAPGIYYKLDDTGTTAADSSGSARAGTYRGTVTRSQADACARDNGSAVLFSGASGSYLSNAAQLQFPTTYTVEAWVKTDSTAGGLVAGVGTAQTGASSTVDRVLYLTPGGRFAFGVNNAAKTVITASVVSNNNAWHHVMATAGAEGTRLYVDGTLAASGTTAPTGTFTGYFRVGYDSLTSWSGAPTGTVYLKATLDEVAAYGTSLTAADAASHYQAAV